MAEFVSQQEDVSSDRGAQFRFTCDRCTFVFESKPVQTLKGELWRAAGRIVGGAASGMSEGAFELRRAAGDPELAAGKVRAIAEAKAHFKPCSACGRWVCVQGCYNAAAQSCEDCVPNPDEEALRSAARAITDRERERRDADDRLYDRVEVERTMKAKEVLGRTCPKCGAAARRGRFCDACGAGLDVERPACGSCGAANAAGARFCAGCGRPLESP